MNRAASKPSIFLSLFVVQLWICQSARGQVIQPCNRIDGCSCNYKGDVFQLKYLGDYINKISSDKYLTATHGVDEYYFNPCQPFTRSGSVGTGCTNVLACQHHPDEYDIGSPSSYQPYSPSYSIDGGEVTLVYFAKSTGMWPIRQSKVTCKCDRSIKSLPIFVAKGETDVGSAQYAFDLQHTCCCPGECNSGMPAGVDGGPSKWTNWGKCSEKCGGGVQSRQRSCSNPSPSGNGKTCLQQGFKMEENRKCDSQICPGMTVIIVSALVLVSVLSIVAAILYIFFGKRTSHSAIRMTAAKSILPTASDDGFKSQRPHVKVSDVGANPYLEL